MTSWKAGVKTSGDKDWCYNALRFATKEEAEGYVENLMWRWLAVTDTHVEECQDDPVNYKWENNKVVAVPTSGC